VTLPAHGLEAVQLAAVAVRRWWIVACRNSGRSGAVAAV
jgi:hypothetical protein